MYIYLFIYWDHGPPEHWRFSPPTAPLHGRPAPLIFASIFRPCFSSFWLPFAFHYVAFLTTFRISISHDFIKIVD